MDEKYFHEPYALDQAQPEMTTMPTDARTKVMSPCQVVECFITGAKGTSRAEAMTSDNRLMIMRNDSLIVSDCDMVSDRTMMTRYELANDQVLILKTPGMSSAYENFVATYCVRSPKVAKVFESPLTRQIPGASLQELVVRHHNELVNLWTGGSGEYGLMCAKVFMFIKWHVGMFGSSTSGFNTFQDGALRDVYFCTDSHEALHEDLRVYKAMREIAK